jgi:hypothetical protein
VCAVAAISRFCAREVINLQLTPASAAESTGVENRVEDGIEAHFAPIFTPGRWTRTTSCRLS